MNLHLRYLKHCLQLLPREYSSAEPTRLLFFYFYCYSRLSLVYFCLSSIDLLSQVNQLIPKDQQLQICQWLLDLLIISDSDCGWRGSDMLGSGHSSCHQLDTSHLTMTYCALLSLMILGYDLHELPSSKILNSLKQLQLPNGCFKSSLTSNESDLRFCTAQLPLVLSLVIILELINNWQSVTSNNVNLLMVVMVSCLEMSHTVEVLSVHWLPFDCFRWTQEMF